MKMIVAVAAMSLLLTAKISAAPDIASLAATHIGRGETAADNVGPWVKRYLKTSKPLPWCAGFVSFVLRDAGKSVPYTLSSRAFLKIGKRVEDPQPGDVAVFWRGKRAGPLGHSAIVERVTENAVVIIEGNRGGFPAVVRRRRYARADERKEKLLGYVRI